MGGSALPRFVGPPEERFKRYVQINKETGCHEWIGGKNCNGYGSFGISSRHTVLAHRFSYVMSKGPIPDGLVIDHLCRVPRCVNPDHLEAVTNRENGLRGIGPQARRAVATHCDRGHPFDAENTRWRKSGHRSCKACAGVSAAASRARVRLARGTRDRQKVPTSERETIRAVAAAGENFKVIAERYGVSRSTIHAICKGDRTYGPLLPTTALERALTERSA